MVLILCDCFCNLQGRAGLREGCKLHVESRNLDETIAVYMCSCQELARCNLQVVLLLMTALHVNAHWMIENPISSMVSPLSYTYSTKVQHGMCLHTCLPRLPNTLAYLHSYVTDCTGWSKLPWACLGRERPSLSVYGQVRRSCSVCSGG